MGKKMTLSQVSEQIGLTDKTIRKYIKSGELKASFEDSGPGKQCWYIDEDDLYKCKASTIRNALDPKRVREFDTKDDQIKKLLRELEEKNMEILALENKDEEIENIDEYAILKEELKKQKKATAIAQGAFSDLLKVFQVSLDMHSGRKIKKLTDVTGLKIDYEMLDDDGDEWELTYTIANKFKVCNKYIVGPDTYDGLYKYSYCQKIIGRKEVAPENRGLA